jgi:hypothetical protein
MRLGPEASRQWSLFIRVTQTLVGALLAGGALSYLVIRHLGLSELWSVPLLFLALAMAMREIYRFTLKLREKKDE